MKTRSWSTRAAMLAVIVLAALLFVAPAVAAGPSIASIFTSKNPASAGEGVSMTVVVSGTFQSPLGLVQLFDGLTPLGPPLVLTPDFDFFLGCKCVPTDHSSASLTRPFSAGDHPLTVDYTGDGPLGNLPIFGGGFVLLVVTAAQSTTTVTSTANPSVFGQSVTFIGSATNAGAPAAGSIQFKIDGADVGGPLIVGPGGTASLDTSSLSVAGHSVTADFTSSDPNVLDSSGTLAGGQVVNPANTSTTVSSTNDPSEFGAATIFSASVSVDAPGAGAPSGLVQFADNGVALGSPQAVTGGQASLVSASLPVGSHTISASFTSDTPNLNNSVGSTVQTVTQARTTLVYDGQRAGDFDDTAVLSARLSRTDNGAALSGSVVRLTMGAESCTAVTGTDGEAACSIVPTEAAGAFTVTAAFAGDGNYLASLGSAPFAVTLEETATVYVGPTVIAQGSPVVLAGRLNEDGVSPIAGRSLTLSIGSAPAGQSCVAGPTDATGVARCTIAGVTVAQGAEPVRAAFAGDAYYLPSAGAANVIVFAFPSRGIFTLGAQTSSGAVTYWGSSWAKVNGGPDGFKGFAGDPGSTPPACGATWSSSPGNSSSPVATVPAYMGTAVTGPLTKTGDAISGRITHIVVVATDSGYGPSPGHAGTGSVIATYC